MTTQGWWWIGAGAAAALAVAAGLADWLRARRRNLDSPGWVPWRGLQVVALFAAAVLAMFATL